MSSHQATVESVCFLKLPSFHRKISCDLILTRCEYDDTMMIFQLPQPNFSQTIMAASVLLPSISLPPSGNVRPMWSSPPGRHEADAI